MANITTVHLPYGYLLANTPLTLQGVGKVVSPKLKVLYGESQDNWQNYIFMQAVAKGNLSSFVKIAEAFLGTPLPQDITANSKYDILIHIQKLREVFIQALSLFFINRIEYFDEYGFVFFNEKTDDVEGCLNAETFELYCSIISQLMHDGKVEKQPQKAHEDFSDKPPEVLHALKMFEKYSNTSKSESSKTYLLDNIISKMSVVNSGYNLLTIYELTVWQLFDQFQAYTQNRISKLSERSYSIWGGEGFDFELWLKNNN